MKQTSVLNVRVTDDIAAWIKKKVEDGTYASVSEAMRELLREMVTEHG